MSAYDSARDGHARARRLYLGLGFALYPLLIVVVPVAWAFSPVPIDFLTVGKWLYVIAAVAFCAAFVAKGYGASARRKAFIVAFLSLLAVTMLFFALGVGAGRVLEPITPSTVVNKVGEWRSPSGRLRLVHNYIDQGGLGGNSAYYVEGRLLPGLLEWHWDVPSDEYYAKVRWVNGRTVSVGAGKHRVPAPLLWLAW